MHVTVVRIFSTHPRPKVKKMLAMKDFESFLGHTVPHPSGKWVYLTHVDLSGSTRCWDSCAFPHVVRTNVEEAAKNLVLVSTEVGCSDFTARQMIANVLR